MAGLVQEKPCAVLYFRERGQDLKGLLRDPRLITFRVNEMVLTALQNTPFRSQLTPEMRNCKWIRFPVSTLFHMLKRTRNLTPWVHAAETVSGQKTVQFFSYLREKWVEYLKGEKMPRDEMFKEMVADCARSDSPEKRMLSVDIAAAIVRPRLREHVLKTLFRSYFEQRHFGPAEEALGKIKNLDDRLDGVLQLIVAYLEVDEFQSIDRVIRRRIPPDRRKETFLRIAINYLDQRQYEKAIVLGSSLEGSTARTSFFRDLLVSLERGGIQVRAMLGRALKRIDPQNRERCLHTWFALFLEQRKRRSSRNERNIAEARATWAYEQMAEGPLKEEAGRHLVCSLTGTF